jgi:hypothetical protein
MSGQFVFIIAAVLLTVRVEIACSLGILSNYTLSCALAKDSNFTKYAANSNLYCNDIVMWSTASLYDNTFYSTFSPGTPLDLLEQDVVARNTAHQLLTYSKVPVTSQCAKMVKWFACVQTFPYCLLAGGQLTGGISYLPACEMHCDLVRSLCSLEDNNLLYCNRESYKMNSVAAAKYSQVPTASYRKKNENRNCLAYVPKEYQLLPQDRVSLCLTIAFGCLL